MPVACDLIIPAFNEETNITALFDALDALRASHPGLVRHIVVADNDSADATPKLAAERGAVVVHEPQRGYGAACLKAMAWIDELTDPPDFVAYLDADLSDDPALLPNLLEPINSGEAEIVIGCRQRLAEPGALNHVQRFGNMLACSMMRLFSGRRYHDLGPFRVVKWATLTRLAMADRTWGWTVEMQMKAAILEIPVVEVDVPYRRRHSGKSKISGTVRGVIKAGAKIFSTIFALWWRRKRIRVRSDEAHIASRRI